MSRRDIGQTRRAGMSPARRRPSRRRRFRAYLLGLTRTGRLPAFLLSVGLGVLLFAFALTDDFGIDTVIIRGNSIAYADSIVESSDALGRSIFQIDTNAVAQKVADHPVVASAEVQARFPDRLIVDVVERTPAIVWQTDEQAVLVDEFGWVLAEGEQDELPRVVDVDGDLPEPGEMLGAERVAAVRFLNEEFSAASAVEYSVDDGFTVHLGDNQVIALGSADELPVKMQVVTSVQETDLAWTHLDVRDPERPFYQ